MRFRVGIGLAALAWASLACSEQTGSITADVVFTGPAGQRIQALRTLATPPGVATLVIVALDADSSTLAMTQLALDPVEGQQRLIPIGGEWMLDAVPVGADRSIVGSAFLERSTVAGLDRVLAYRGRIDGLTVRPGPPLEAGPLFLRQLVGVRNPSTDRDAPVPPANVQLWPPPEGEALEVIIAPTTSTDAAGYVVAVGPADREPPVLNRAQTLRTGEPLVPGSGYVVAQLLDTPSPAPSRIDALDDNVLVRVAVYAFDPALDGQPLNYSVPFVVEGAPLDTAPPGPPLDFQIVARSPTDISIRFLAPGEDGATGTPAGYEMRTASHPRALIDPALFVTRVPLVPPPVENAGAQVTAAHTFLSLGEDAQTGFFLGVRAVDASGNAGPSAIVEFVPTATDAIDLREIQPAIALAGQPVTLFGRGFGASGTVTLAEQRTNQVRPLTARSWVDEEITVEIPANAHSGLITIAPATTGTATAYLPVVARVGPASPSPDTMAFAGHSVDPSSHASAVYKQEALNPFNFENGIERFFLEAPESVLHHPHNAATQSRVLAGTHSRETNQFLFAIAERPNNLNLYGVSDAAAAAPTLRIDAMTLPNIEQADRLSMVSTAFGAAGLALAVSVSGVVFVADTADAFAAPLEPVFALTSTNTFSDRAVLGRTTIGSQFLAYRSVAGTTELVLMQNDAGTDVRQFVPIAAAARPKVGSNFFIHALADTATIGESVVVSYESLETNGPQTIRLLLAETYGTRLGYAPYYSGTTAVRLEGAGVVYQGTRTVMAILMSEIVASTGLREFRYTELPFEALDGGRFPDTRVGRHPGSVVLQATADSRGHLSCTPLATYGCHILITAQDTATLLFRR